MHSTSTAHGTTLQPLRHTGLCGPRVACWRRACRDEFRDYPTIEILITGDAIAFCHRAVLSGFDRKVDRWHERRAA